MQFPTVESGVSAVELLYRLANRAMPEAPPEPALWRGAEMPDAMQAYYQCESRVKNQRAQSGSNASEDM